MLASSEKDPNIPDYLSPDYDLNKATKPTLKSILTANGVPFPPADQKRGYYVDLFQTHIAQNRAKLIAQYRKTTKPSKAKPWVEIATTRARASSSLTLVDDESEEQTLKPSATSSKAAALNDRKRRRRTVATPQDLESEDIKSRSSSSSPPVRAGTSSRSAQEQQQYDDIDEIFSDDNPFQSGGESPNNPRNPLRKKKLTKKPKAEEDQDVSTAKATYEAPPRPAPVPSRATTNRRRTLATSQVGGKNRPPGAVASPLPFMFKAPETNFVKPEDPNPPVFTSRAPETASDAADVAADTPRRRATRAASRKSTSEILSPTTNLRRSTRGSRKSMAVMETVNSDNDSAPASSSASPPIRSKAATIQLSPSSSSSEFLNKPRMPLSPDVSYGKKVLSTPPPPLTPEHVAEADKVKEEEDSLPATTLATTTRPAKASKTTKKSTKTKSESAAGTTTTKKVKKGKSKEAQEKTRQRSGALFDPYQLFTLVLLVALGLFAHWYVSFKDVIGYCDPEVPAHNGTVKYTGYNPLGYVLPVCRPCPPHGVCVGNTLLSCDSMDLTVERHWLAKLIPPGYLPFPLEWPSCVQDLNKRRMEVRKQERMKNLVNTVDETVRKWVGKVQCGEIQLPADEYGWVWSRSSGRGEVIGMPMNLCKDELVHKLSKKWTLATFEEAWETALPHIPTALSSTTTTSSKNPARRVFISHNPPVMSLPCRLRRSMWETIRAYYSELVLSGLTLIGCLVLWYRRQMALHDARIVSMLVEDVLDMIHEESENNRLDPVRHPVPGLPLVQLRDHFLPLVVPKTTDDDANSDGSGGAAVGSGPILDPSGRTRWYLPDPRSRDRIWKQVASLVLRNSNVRELMVEVRGEEHVVWEWVGSFA
ncbi:inner nuclear membrane protein enriched at telomere/subtelomere region, partial [Quaeritorhiza haematococci]